MSSESAEFIDRVAWEKMDSLVPAIIQNAQTQRVLMLGYMNRESLARTIDSGLVTFYSRSRKTLWCKGETSGNALEFVSVSLDCDQDTFLVQANPAGPTCHLNTESCFDHGTLSAKATDAETKNELCSSSIGIGDFLGELQSLIHERKKENQSQSNSEANSGYTQSLFASGVKRMAQKVGEEAEKNYSMNLPILSITCWYYSRVETVILLMSLMCLKHDVVDVPAFDLGM